MKYFRLLFSTLLILLYGCGTSSDFNQVLEDLQENLDFGNISTVIQIDDSLNKVTNENKEILHIADSLRQIAERISIDFCVSENQVISQIEKLNGAFSSKE